MTVREYTLPCGTKIRDEIFRLGDKLLIDRYIMPVKPLEMIQLDVHITRDGVVTFDPAEWTIEAVEDLMSEYGYGLEDELIAIIHEEGIKEEHY